MVGKNQGRKGTPKNFCDKDFAELSGDFLVGFASKPLFYWVAPSNCSENSLVLFVRFFGFGVLLWLVKETEQVTCEN